MDSSRRASTDPTYPTLAPSKNNLPLPTATRHAHHLSNFTSRDSGFGEVFPGSHTTPTKTADEMTLEVDEPQFAPRAGSSTLSSPDLEYSQLRLTPATRTSVVTTTTTTTVHFAPILIPRSRRATRRTPTPSGSGSNALSETAPNVPSSFAQFIEREESRKGESSSRRLDPKRFPLSQAPWPAGINKFRLDLGGNPAIFMMDSEAEMGGPEEEEAARGHNPAKRGDKGKGKETADRIFDYDPAAAAAQSPTSPRNQLTRSERGANALRRRSRGSYRRGPLGNDATNFAFTHDGEEGEGEQDGEEAEAALDLARMEGIITTPQPAGGRLGGEGARFSSPGPPRKRPRSTTDSWRDQQRSMESTGGLPASSLGPPPLAPTLPRPNLSPPSPVPTHGGEEEMEIPARGEEAIDLGSGRELSGLLALPDFIDMFDQLTPALQSYFIFTFLKRSSVPVLQTINNIIAPSLRRDFLADLPPEMGVHVLGFLDAKSLCRASVVCRGWNRLVDGEWRVWKDRLDTDGLWVGDGSDEREALELVNGSKEELFLTRWKAGVWSHASKWENGSEGERMQLDQLDAPSPAPSLRRFSSSTQAGNLGSPASSQDDAPPSPSVHFIHPFKSLYRRRFLTRRNWVENEPTRITFAANGNSVVTCLQFDQEKIVSASDDHSINVFDTRTGNVLARLDGHDGGVWALQYIGNILVSGSTDRTVRVWDLDTGKCTHIFVGHTSTVRCLQIVQPENINPDPNGEPIWEPAFPLIVTGSRDWSLRVWKLPSPGEDTEYHPVVPMSPSDENTDVGGNPFHLHHLAGHRQAVRALAAHGRTLVSGSYDTVVRVWDMVTGRCVHTLKGHSQKVYTVAYDPLRKQCASGSMDGTVRLWSTMTGECRATLEGHSSLVGLLGLSYRHLVSAAADSTLRIWDPETGEHRYTLAAHAGAITCFQHDEYKVVSGSDGTLKMWDARDGTFTRDLLTGLTGVWQVSFNERFCVAAVQRNGQSEFEILDFGSVEEEVTGEEREQQRFGGAVSLEELD